MSEYACDFQMAKNSNSSVSREFLLEVLITCFLPEIAPNSKHIIFPIHFLFKLSHLSVILTIEIHSHRLITIPSCIENQHSVR